MSEILSGVTKIASLSVGIGSALGAETNAYKAMTEEDTEKRELYGKRNICVQRIGWEKTKFVLLSIILPILILVIIAVMDTKYKITQSYPSYKYTYIISIIAIIGGIAATSYKNWFGWPLRIYEIANAKKIDIDTCKVSK